MTRVARRKRYAEPRGSAVPAESVRGTRLRAWWESAWRMSDSQDQVRRTMKDACPAKVRVPSEPSSQMPPSRWRRTEPG
ncbi:hypothetical protein Shyd_95180 [Streptomyces hydrogenans]|uniref:Uncharacterized protein n=1 Tax=Streptomyces hydrogenans TaxID=1873719 RepID=A0ABQ3PT07_9ACTN|nr:hypothetical protein GCM10018784_06740 [Streptomyces hydrogenans]GHI28147.1 hypothetical protein Shyd_95180 [Streptomyces hydrogenans]